MMEEPTWQARETVREVDHKPHLLVRVSVPGYFEHRALEPVMRIVREGEHGQAATDSWFTEIGDDQRELHGYFRGRLPDAGIIEYGFPDRPLHRMPLRFDGKLVKRLDRERLGKDVVIG